MTGPAVKPEEPKPLMTKILSVAQPRKGNESRVNGRKPIELPIIFNVELGKYLFASFKRYFLFSSDDSTLKLSVSSWVVPIAYVFLPVGTIYIGPRPITTGVGW